MSAHVYYDLIKDYAHVCNVAMLANKHRFPFKQIFDAAENGHMGEQIEVTVSSGSSKESYIFQIKEQEIRTQPHDKCRDCQCVRQWYVSLDYLQDVAQSPEKYIENPANINWEWLYDTKH